MLILSKTQYFRGVDTANTKHNAVLFLGVDSSYTKQDAVFSERGYCLYWTVRSIFGGVTLLKLSKTQYFRGVDIAYTKHGA